ncbi:MAG: hypothetical protein Q9196_001335, partial [Gyalolechia fulgens]
HWFYAVLICGIMAILITTGCVVKAIRPKPWKRGVGSFKRGLGFGKPARIYRKGAGGGGSGIPPTRVWPGTETGRMGQTPPRDVKRSQLEGMRREFRQHHSMLYRSQQGLIGRVVTNGRASDICGLKAKKYGEAEYETGS